MKLSMSTVFAPLAWPARAGGGRGLAGDQRRGEDDSEATILFIGPIYGAAAAGVQRRCEKSTAETAVARLRLETPSRIGIARRASARSSSASLRP